MGKKYIRGKLLKEQWTEDNPTKNYCYVVSEFVYWYQAPRGTIPYKVNVPGDDGLHRFLRWPCGTIIDLTVEQFPDYSLVDYDKGKVQYFMQIARKGPSKRARHLAKLMGFKEDGWNRFMVGPQS